MWKPLSLLYTYILLNSPYPSKCNHIQAAIHFICTQEVTRPISLVPSESTQRWEGFLRLLLSFVSYVVAYKGTIPLIYVPSQTQHCPQSLQRNMTVLFSSLEIRSPFVTLSYGGHFRRWHSQEQTLTRLSVLVIISPLTHSLTHSLSGLHSGKVWMDCCVRRNYSCLVIFTSLLISYRVQFISIFSNSFPHPFKFQAIFSFL